MKKKEENTNFEGFDYDVKLNQIGAMAAGLEGKIFDYEILIFESFIKFSTWRGCEKIVRENEIYYHYPWQKVTERLPFIRIKGRTPIKDRFKKLSDVKLLKPHPNNVKMGKSFFAFGEKYEAYSNIQPIRQDGRTHPPRRTHPSAKTDAPIRQDGRDPSAKTDAYDSTNDYTNDITMIFLKEKFKKFKNFENTWLAWKEYLVKKKRPIKDQEQEEAAFEHLLNVSGESLREAKKIIMQAKGSGYTNLIPLLGGNKNISTNEFPDEWDPEFQRKLGKYNTALIPKYWAHLRSKGFIAFKNEKGIIYKWAIPQPSTI